VLVVGTANSGAEIAKELAPLRRVWLSGRDVGELPFRIDGRLARLLVPFIFRVVFHRVLTVRTPVGRRARAKLLGHGMPRIRVKGTDLAGAGVERVARVTGVRAGRPELEDGTTLEPASVVWCTGFQPGFSWIHVPILDENGDPRHERGVVPEAPGLYFVGLNFLHAASSTMIHGVSRDAARIAAAIARRAAAGARRKLAPA
jgi:putative flavoprotein involved in K+ transport